MTDMQKIGVIRGLKKKKEKNQQNSPYSFANCRDFSSSSSEIPLIIARATKLAVIWCPRIFVSLDVVREVGKGNGVTNLSSSMRLCVA